MTPPAFGFGPHRGAQRRPAPPSVPTLYTPANVAPGLPAQPSRTTS